MNDLQRVTLRRMPFGRMTLGIMAEINRTTKQSDEKLFSEE
jgi:hypothetical protein